MKTKEYNKYIQGYIYALNECADGNVAQLKVRFFQTDYYDNFDNGLLKGIYEFEKKKETIR